MSANQQWQGVPTGTTDAWRALFNAAPTSEGMNLTAACPVCGARTLHQYFSLEEEAPRELRGALYRGPGSYWEWCSTCHSFEHMHGYVPDWWSKPPLHVDHSRLTAVPDMLEAARAKS